MTFRSSIFPSILLVLFVLRLISLTQVDAGDRAQAVALWGITECHGLWRYWDCRFVLYGGLM